MNILFVNEIPMNPLYGGIERVTDILTRELVLRGGYRVFYLCARVDSIGMLDYNFPAEKQFVLPHTGGFRNLDNVIWYNELLIQNKIDIVVNQRGWAPFMNAVLDSHGIPSVSVIHCVPMGMHIMYIRGILRHNKTFDGVWRYVFKLIIYPFYYLCKYYKSVKSIKSHYRDLVSKSSAVVLLSNECRKEFDNIIASFVPKCKTYSIPNPNVYKLLSKDEHKKQNIVLYVGRLCENQKRPLRMLKIWEMLYKKFPEWEMIFVGSGDALSAMNAYASRNKIKNVVFVGQVLNVEEYYRKSDFICLTSDFEGWGMTLTEGMNFGCIPFTFANYGAASEIIDDDVNGCLIPAFNLKLYAERLAILMQNKFKRETMSKAAIEKVMSFSVDRVADQWIKLFNEVKNNK